MTETKTKTDKKYIEGVGKRKTSVARVRIFAGEKASFVINERKITDYFPTKELQEIVSSPFTIANPAKEFMVSVKVSGGGIHSQAEAVRHGISRALNIFDKELRSPLKKAGLLTRDSRIKERRKFGLKKARKSPQWSKR